MARERPVGSAPYSGRVLGHPQQHHKTLLAQSVPLLSPSSTRPGCPTAQEVQTRAPGPPQSVGPETRPSAPPHHAWAHPCLNPWPHMEVGSLEPRPCPPTNLLHPPQLAPLPVKPPQRPPSPLNKRQSLCNGNHSWKDHSILPTRSGSRQLQPNVLDQPKG